jgi:hypothetical protein
MSRIVLSYTAYRIIIARVPENAATYRCTPLHSQIKLQTFPKDRVMKLTPSSDTRHPFSLITSSTQEGG